MAGIYISLRQGLMINFFVVNGSFQKLLRFFHMRKNIFLLPTILLSSCALAQSPSFDCSKATSNITTLICASNDLSELDNELAKVYSLAQNKAQNEHPSTLKAEQRGWIKGRDDCWKSNNKKQCVFNSYRHRIAELQARYQLIPVTLSSTYFCSGNLKNEVVINFFNTLPKIAIAEYADSVSVMYSQQNNENKYLGRNETLLIKDNIALITWGYSAPQMSCEVKSNG